MAMKKKMKCCLRDGHNVFAPKCFTCKAAATHVSACINPAGYHDYQCAEHAVDDPAATWGSDPGWNTPYVTLDDPKGKAIWEEEKRTKRESLRAKGWSDAQIDAAISQSLKA